MKINFSETFGKVEECFKESHMESKLTRNLASVTIIRDVYGKIRLFLEPNNGFKPDQEDLDQLENSLELKLGCYYGKDIWLPEGEKDGYKALIEQIEKCRIEDLWKDQSITPKLYILERHIAKKAWAKSKPSNVLPWTVTLVDQGHKPAIITFFSFKGGVGRTTALAATALTLSRNGHRVAIVDLDLEAPGLSNIFFKENPASFGVIDYLLEKKVQPEKWSLKDDIKLINEPLLFGDDGEIIRLLPVGNLDNDYLEKLARLDFQNLVDHELPKVFQAMLKELEAVAKPLDFILLDSRAGFHDIGGLALTDLSHGAVIFGTQSRQSWSGMTHVIRRLSQFSGEAEKQLILVHSMAPSLTASGRNEELKLFKEKAYITFQDNYYDDTENVPNLDDTEAVFTPSVVSFQSDLRGDVSLFLRDDSKEEEDRLEAMVKLMTNPDSDYTNIAKKICSQYNRKFNKINGE